MMRARNGVILATAGLGMAIIGGYSGTGGRSPAGDETEASLQENVEANALFGDPHQNARKLIDEGRKIFRFDTYGDEAFWSGQLQIQQSVAKLSPKTALDLGLKVDAHALP